uniref:Ig-like domain-containing protein n=1 Tax=Cuerna arida TaxID=1464854 RepID=A0A1B6G6V4_9HEMI
MSPQPTTIMPTTTFPTTTMPTTTVLPQAEGGNGPVNVTARVGSEIFFDCKTPMSEGHIVAWSYVSPKSGILSSQTVNLFSFGTHRTSSFQAPNNYRLRINSVNHEDEGVYYCFFHSAQNIVKKVFLKVTEHED